MVKQHDLTDCAAACLHSVAGYAGVRVPIARIRQFASTDRKGTNVLGLVEAATRLGFAAEGVRASAENLSSIPLPAIAHIVMRDRLHHYVVVYEVTPDALLIMDPGEGRLRKWTHDEFRAVWSGVLVLLTPREDLVALDLERSNAQRFWHLARPHRGVLALALVSALVYTALALTMSLFVQQLIDSVIAGGDRHLLNVMSFLMVAALVVQLAIGAMKGVLTLRTGQRIDGELILGYYTHLLRLPQQFFDTMRVGEIISRVGDATKIRAFINDVALDLVVNVLIVTLSFGLMVFYSTRLALVMLLVIPAYGAIYYVTNRLNRRTLRELMERSADLQSQLVESVTSMATIKGFGLERYSSMRTETRFMALLRTVYRSATMAISSGAVTELVSRLFTIGLLWLGAGQVLDRTLTLGELMSCFALVGFLTGPVTRLIGMNRTIQDALIASDRLFDIMDLEPEPIVDPVELTAERLGDIQFQDVVFRYGTRVQVFRGLSLTIPRGQVTAIVGESGSGKSTLLSLLQNLYPLDSGRVTIGGVDIQQFGNESLRRLVSVVPQQISLFAGTVIENVAVGELDPDMERLISLCTTLGINEFVEKMAAGYSTHLGENGVALSGGQRQRIAIARALYREPEILILDEATSSLDSISERFVHRAILDLKQRGKTVILITHRLSAVTTADRIVVLVDGTVEEEGTHSELVERRGAYHRLWEQQVPLQVRTSFQTVGPANLSAP